MLVPCSEKIISALTQLAGEGRSKEAFLQAMRDATNGMIKLCGPSAPASVYTTLQQVSLRIFTMPIMMRALARHRRLVVTVHACTVRAMRLQTSFLAWKWPMLSPSCTAVCMDSTVLMPIWGWRCRCWRPSAGWQLDRWWPSAPRWSCA